MLLIQTAPFSLNGRASDNTVPGTVHNNNIAYSQHNMIYEKIVKNFKDPTLGIFFFFFKDQKEKKIEQEYKKKLTENVKEKTNMYKNKYIIFLVHSFGTHLEYGNFGRPLITP